MRKIRKNINFGKTKEKTKKEKLCLLNCETTDSELTNLKKSKVKMNRVILFCRYFLIRMVKLMLINLDQRLRI